MVPIVHWTGKCKWEGTHGMYGAYICIYAWERINAVQIVAKEERWYQNMTCIDTNTLGNSILSNYSRNEKREELQVK